jgi:cobalamin biosynthesis Mg chelatase CobN
MPDKKFDVLGEDELALLTRWFERLHENWVNTRRTTRTCFQCGKPGQFVTDCPEKTENKDGYRHRSSKDGKYRSRSDHKHKSKHKEERRSRKKDGRGRKAQSMVRASDVDSSSAYSTSSPSSSEDEGDRRKNKKASKNFSGLSCFVGDGFCGIARSSGSKRSHQSDSTPTPRTRYMTIFPSCVRRMSVLASCLITVMICLARPRR